jgi:hypothetical protein
MTFGVLNQYPQKKRCEKLNKVAEYKIRNALFPGK